MAHRQLPARFSLTFLLDLKGQREAPVLIAELRVGDSEWSKSYLQVTGRPRALLALSAEAIASG